MGDKMAAGNFWACCELWMRGLLFNYTLLEEPPSLSPAENVRRGRRHCQQPPLSLICRSSKSLDESYQFLCLDKPVIPVRTQRMCSSFFLFPRFQQAGYFNYIGDCVLVVFRLGNCANQRTHWNVSLLWITSAECDDVVEAVDFNYFLIVDDNDFAVVVFGVIVNGDVVRIDFIVGVSMFLFLFCFVVVVNNDSLEDILLLLLMMMMMMMFLLLLLIMMVLTMLLMMLNLTTTTTVLLLLLLSLMLVMMMML